MGKRKRVAFLCLRALGECVICVNRARHHEYLTGAIAVANALKEKPDLSYLHVGANNIGPEGGISRRKGEGGRFCVRACFVCMCELHGMCLLQ